MKQVRLFALSDSGSPYEVLFTNSNKGFTATCSCQAAVNGLLCKHVLDLLAGEIKRLADPSDWDSLESVLEWAEKSELPGLIEELQDAASRVEQAKAEEKRLKKRVGRLIQEGVPFSK